MIEITNYEKPIKFEKVSYNQFFKDFLKCNNLTKEDYINEAAIISMYENIKLPERKTATSAGYDFALPYCIELYPLASVLIPTGIRCKMDDDLVLSIYPRSSIGFKYGIRVANTVGIIDSDYYGADNEGHIMIKLVRDIVPRQFTYSFNEEKETMESNNNQHKNAITSDDWEAIATHPVYQPVKLNLGENFVQGIFTRFVTAGDIVETKRVGGTGSTNQQ